jgi:hypothetical protein
MICNKNAYFFFVMIFLAACKAPLYQTKWQGHEVIADGNPQEWKIPLRFYDDKSKLSYAVTNDLENLYLCIRITDDASQVKVMRAGMQVWIDTSGSNKQVTGILFPQRVIEPPDATPQPVPAPGKRGSGRQSSGIMNLRNRFQKEYKEMLLTGFKPPIRGSVPLENDFGIRLGINWGANRFDSSYIMIYEAVIPFKTFYKNKLSPADSLKRFGISITVTPLARPAPQGGSRSGASARGSGGGGGGRRGGGGGQRSAPEVANPLYETNKIKMRMQLSVHSAPEIKF